MAPEVREAHILEEAILFFAEHGFEGKTRDLARQAGITQPLLYRYFPNKEKLIDRVYEEVYLRRWKPKWESLITDRSISLEERLCQFYKEYARGIYDYVWVRVFVHSGLKGMDINDRYLSIIKNKVLKQICLELRHDQGLPDESKIPISDEEYELAWGLHGSFFYRAIRQYIYHMKPSTDIDTAIENDVCTFVAGAPAVHLRIIKKTKKVKQRKKKKV